MMFDLQGLNIYLIGMMGSGKSTIAPLLAERLGYGFLDTDPTIEKLVGQSIVEIFQTVGETEFRQIETQVLAEVSAYIRLVVATGGGIPIRQENWNHLHQGLVIWLDPSVDLLIERLQGDTTRPILDTSKNLQSKLDQILVERRDRYAEADIHIPIAQNITTEEIVERILTAIPTVLKTPIACPE
ncbi:shikimate kinase [Chamaesiphon sp. VAR_48_metabat_135_sub]|uniref:shikimate kinase n=1 Tax=Chamaesiphon sp. VAR_48_metabat_135_sub TaxID=2964699 RepID=UPI00286BB0DA|nr:shikimate kinase [Chamaesiphon sp. VAR_48_metabat_135_sub]